MSGTPAELLLLKPADDPFGRRNDNEWSKFQKYCVLSFYIFFIEDQIFCHSTHVHAHIRWNTNKYGHRSTPDDTSLHSNLEVLAQVLNRLDCGRNWITIWLALVTCSKTWQQQFFHSVCFFFGIYIACYQLPGNIIILRFIICAHSSPQLGLLSSSYEQTRFCFCLLTNNVIFSIPPLLRCWSCCCCCRCCCCCLYCSDKCNQISQRRRCSPMDAN